MSPALKNGVTDHMWTWEELVAMIDSDWPIRLTDQARTLQSN